MKFFVAARTKQKDNVNQVIKALEKLGHQNLTVWLKEKNIKPYEQHKRLASKYSLNSVEAIKKSDIFILISDKAGTGMYSDFGMALMLNRLFKKPKIYVIGNYISGAIYYFHPSVKIKKNIAEVVKDLNK